MLRGHVNGKRGLKAFLKTMNRESAPRGKSACPPQVFRSHKVVAVLITFPPPAFFLSPYRAAMSNLIPKHIFKQNN